MKVAEPDVFFECGMVAFFRALQRKRDSSLGKQWYARLGPPIERVNRK
jgi:hypothetical protein